RLKILRNSGANALINPHAAKHKVNETVPKATCQEEAGCASLRIQEIQVQHCRAFQICQLTISRGWLSMSIRSEPREIFLDCGSPLPRVSLVGRASSRAAFRSRTAAREDARPTRDRRLCYER